MTRPPIAVKTPVISGFVLAGGESSRMGRDKALLDFGGHPLIQHIASEVATACGSATIVGDLRRHGGFGWPVIPDLHAHIGPLAGIEAALNASPTDWVLVAGCDMPALSAGFLKGLIAELGSRLATHEIHALMPIAPGGPPNPLCALYHRQILPEVRLAIAAGVHKPARALLSSQLGLAVVDDGAPLRNANTPAEWDALLREIGENKESA